MLYCICMTVSRYASSSVGASTKRKNATAPSGSPFALCKVVPNSKVSESLVVSG